ncbi:N-acetyltransferase [Staphylococcus condimenti]|uniref:GNAT family N-acetyltransferase n=1 Tax=Staphylococcus condimenti TaxID=70255 RepID=A0A143PC50_9STAP|nr:MULTISPECIES: GNAT family N-acetyltransferase [Staphylococcus]AMY05900.1 GNAT family acetyltransferase [Staphylococcus condimenti]APR59766.1 GNAT family N-acetyltransferase [Staphylococcus condimenti]MDK8644888.1 GNAT family N-acetyltransferase [Staphylococcus condimenti]OFP03065.1 GNAT family acetyltransferase [Staphylococcus sp. HMSC065E08]PNZ60234.1 N-acetyltransferase [Staphylococcus condimenti]
MYQFRLVNESDLSEILEIENEGFTPKEAATEKALIDRIQNIKDTFIVAESNGEIAGYVNGPVIENMYITDDLFETIEPNPSTGGYIAILGLVVAKDYRNQGLAGQLLKQLESTAKDNQREGITLTCKADLIPFYEKYGYTNDGISASEHGGVQWFNLIKQFT